MLGRNGTYAVFRKLHTRARPRGASTCIRTPRTPPRRSGWARRSSGAGPAGAAVLSPDKDDPRWAPTRNATTPSCTATTRRAKCPVGLARAADEPPRCGRHRPAAHPPHDPARHHLRSAAAPGVLEDDGADRGLMFAFVGRTSTGSSSSSRRSGSTTASSSAHRPTRPAGGPNDGGVAHPQAADSPPPQRAARLRRQSRRILLHAGPEGAALARRARHVTERRCCWQIVDLTGDGPAQTARQATGDQHPRKKDPMKNFDRINAPPRRASRTSGRTSSGAASPAWHRIPGR